MVIQSGLELRNTLLMVLRYSLRSRSCICFFPHLTNYLWLWNCSSVTRMMFLFFIFIHLSLRRSWEITPLSQSVHVFMRGTINVLQSDTDVWILFKWNDIKGFFPLSGLNLPSAVSRLGAQESCPRNWTANSVFFPALYWLRRKPGGAAVRNNSAPSTRDPLVREKVFLRDFNAHYSAAPRASFLPI